MVEMFWEDEERRRCLNLWDCWRSYSRKSTCVLLTDPQKSTFRTDRKSVAWPKGVRVHDRRLKTMLCIKALILADATNRGQQRACPSWPNPTSAWGPLWGEDFPESPTVLLLFKKCPDGAPWLFLNLSNQHKDRPAVMEEWAGNWTIITKVWCFLYDAITHLYTTTTTTHTPMSHSQLEKV